MTTPPESPPTSDDLAARLAALPPERREALLGPYLGDLHETVAKDARASRERASTVDGYESDLNFIEGALGQLDNETIRECATRVARLAEAAVAWGRTNTDGMRESDTELAGAIVDFLAAVARDGSPKEST